MWEVGWGAGGGDWGILRGSGTAATLLHGCSASVSFPGCRLPAPLLLSRAHEHTGRHTHTVTQKCPLDYHAERGFWLGFFVKRSQARGVAMSVWEK